MKWTRNLNGDDPHFVEDITTSPVDVIAVFADDKEDIFNSAISAYQSVAKPRGRILLIRTVPTLDGKTDFDSARRFLVNAPAHNGIIAETDGNTIKRVLRVSMQYNHHVVEGTEEEILDNLAIWVRMHYEQCMVTDRSEIKLSSDQIRMWLASDIHNKMSVAATKLLEKGVIEHQVSLERYEDVPGRAALIMRAINRSALGESMRAIWDSNSNILAVTRSGGQKGVISPDPRDKHLVPVVGLTSSGYILGNGEHEGLDLKYENASVEAHEIARLLQAISLIKNGFVSSYEDYMTWFNSNISLYQDRMPIVLDGIQMPDLSFDHVHWYLDHEALSVKNFNGTRIYVATPTIFDPSIDAACGSKYGAQMSLSALFNPEMVRMIRSSHTFRDFIGVIHLPGHGSIWIHGDRENLTNAMTSLPLKKPDTV